MQMMPISLSDRCYFLQIHGILSPRPYTFTADSLLRVTGLQTPGQMGAAPLLLLDPEGPEGLNWCACACLCVCVCVCARERVCVHLSVGGVGRPLEIFLFCVTLFPTFSQAQVPSCKVS